MLQTASNPGGLPIEVFDQLGAGVSGDRSQFYQDLSRPFFGVNRPGANVSQGMLDMFWLWSMQIGLKAAYVCIKAFSETEQTADLKRFDVPTLIIHGDNDQIVPIADSALLSAKLVNGATLKVYPGAPHGLTITHQQQFNEDLLALPPVVEPGAVRSVVSLWRTALGCDRFRRTSAREDQEVRT